MAEGEPQSSKAERVDFLKQVIAFNEANIRSYDIKANIALVAFVLSGNPLVAAVNGACGAGAHRAAGDRSRGLYRRHSDLRLGTLAGWAAAREADRGT